MMADKKTANKNTGPAASEDESVIKAHEQAEADIENDADLRTGPETGDDLDEGELAKLEGED